MPSTIRFSIKNVDNSGCTKAKLLQDLKSYNIYTKNNYETGKIYKAVMSRINRKNVKTKWVKKKKTTISLLLKYNEKIKRLTEFYINSRTKASSLLKDLEDFQPIGNRINVVIYREIKQKGFLKIKTIAITEI